MSSFEMGTLRGSPTPPAMGTESTPSAQTRLGTPGERSSPAPDAIEARAEVTA
jgi:hypothetical protein